MRKMYVSVIAKLDQWHHRREWPTLARRAYAPIGWLACGLYDLEHGCPLGQAFFPRHYRRLPKLLDPVWKYSTIKWESLEPVEIRKP